MAAGAGGLAVGVHTTQFEIRDPEIGLFQPVLQLAAEEMDRADAKRSEPMVRIAGAIGKTPQAVRKAQTARDLGYHAVLLGLKAMQDADVDALIAHCREVAQVLPIVGFYLQDAVGGQVLPHAFWRRLCGNRKCGGDQDGAVSPLSHAGRGARGGGVRARGYRAVHGQ